METQVPTAPAPKIDAASALLLAELEAATARLAGLEREAARLRTTRRELHAALSPLLRAMGEEARRPVQRRMGQIEGMLWGERRTAGASRRSAAALRWMLENDQVEVRAAELNFYLRRQGFDCEPRYAARLLGEWLRKGIVFRTGHGLYRLNHANRSVFAMAMRRICPES